MKCHSPAPCAFAWLSLYIIPCVLCVYALSLCVVFVTPVCFPTITMTHLYSLITLMYINTCRNTLNALRQIHAHTHTTKRGSWDARSFNSCTFPPAGTYTCCRLTKSRARGQVLCLQRLGEEAGSSCGVPPVSLCVLIEVFFCLSTLPSFLPPCWLEEDEGGGDLRFEGSVSYQALLSLARCSSPMIGLLCSTCLNKLAGRWAWWRGIVLCGNAARSLSGNREQQET